MDKNSSYTFYVHNLAKYDNFYLVPVKIALIVKYPKLFSHEFIYRDNHIIGIKLSKKVGKKSSKKAGKKTDSLRIVDSYTILSASLNELCKTFNTEGNKYLFPYEFVKNKNLFYVGYKPDISF